MMNQIKTKKHVKPHNSHLEELLNWGPMMMMEISRHGALNLKKKHTWVNGLQPSCQRIKCLTHTYALNTWEIALSINHTPLPVRAAIILDYTHLSKQALSHE
jgi:hypothetical protein